MSLDSTFSMGAAVLAALGVGSGAKARIKAARLVATSEVWREEAEAQKARGDRLEAAVHELTEQVGSLRADVRRLTGVLRMVAPELIKGEVDDDD